jgi:hypothetical protein
MPSPLGDHLNGYDIERDPPYAMVQRDGQTILVKCASDGAVRAGAHIGNDGKVDHVAVEPSPFGVEAIKILAMLL